MVSSKADDSLDKEQQREKPEAPEIETRASFAAISNIVRVKFSSGGRELFSDRSAVNIQDVLL